MTPPKSPQTNGMVERFNGPIEEVLQSHHFRSGEELETTLHRYVWLYNRQLPQSALGSKSPLQAMKDWHKLKPQLFRKQPYYLPGCDTLLDPWHRRPNLRRMPSSRRHALLHMHAVPFGRLWPFPPVTRVVAVPAGGNDIVRGIRTTLGTRMEMLGGAAEDFRQASRPAGYRQTQVQGLIPHVETAVIAESLLCDHLLAAQILKCFHGTDTPFDFMRSECAASQGDAPRQEAYARARPEISWFRRPDSET